MSQRNKYLEGAIENFYRREKMHIMIFTFIDLYRFLYESVTIEEAAKAFMSRYNIDEEMFSQDSIISVYYRVNKDLTDMQRLNKNKTKAFPIKT